MDNRDEEGREKAEFLALLLWPAALGLALVLAFAVPIAREHIAMEKTGRRESFMPPITGILRVERIDTTSDHRLLLYLSNGEAYSVDPGQTFYDLKDLTYVFDDVPVVLGRGDDGCLLIYPVWSAHKKAEGVPGVCAHKLESPHDKGVIDDLSRYSCMWNQITGQLVQDYLDPAASAESWASSGRVSIRLLQRTYLAMNASLARFQSTELRTLYQPVIANYRRKLDGIIDLHLAVVRGDAGAEVAALAAIQKAVEEGKQLGVEHLDTAKDPLDLETRKAGSGGRSAP